MTADTFIQVAQLSTILIGSLGIVVAMRSNRRQMNAQMFIEFSARFHSVLQAMPPEAWFQAEGHFPILEPSPEMTRHSLQWFHLVASLYHLRKMGYISQDLWRPAQLGVKRMLESPLFQREWFNIEPAFSHYPEYCRYVRRMISDGEYAHNRHHEVLP